MTMTDDLVNRARNLGPHDSIAYAENLAAELADAIEALTADNARLRADLEPLMRYVPHSVVECRGDKCREPWCVSCCGEDAAIVALARVQTYAAAARAALNTGKADT